MTRHGGKQKKNNNKMHSQELPRYTNSLQKLHKTQEWKTFNNNA